MSLGDGTCKIFLNTQGTNPDEISKALNHFLRYFVDSSDKCVESINDELITKLHKRITSLKNSREWEAGYMKMSEILEKTRREGIKEGIHNALFAILETKGEVSEKIKNRIVTETDMEVLDKWIKLAVTSENVEEFEKNM